MNKRGMDLIRRASPLTPEQRSQRILNDARLTESKAQRILTPQQRQRLRQIDLQLKGTRAFEEPEVLEALHLDATKREQIRSIQVQAFLAAFDCRSYDPHKPDRPTGPPLNGPFNRPRPEDRLMPPHTDPVEQIEREVLTTEQRDRWRELTGRPFKGRGRPPMGRFGPPPPPPPR
jgi:hypothetical protein